MTTYSIDAPMVRVPRFELNAGIFLIGLALHGAPVSSNHNLDTILPPSQMMPTIPSGIGIMQGNVQIPEVEWMTSPVVDNFEEAMGAVYQKLLAAQKPYDSEVDQALYSNIWDLYAYADAT